MHAYLMDSSYKAGSELAQAMTLEDTDSAAARLGDREQFTLEQVARGYVSGELSQYTEEIEQL